MKKINAKASIAEPMLFSMIFHGMFALVLLAPFPYAQEKKREMERTVEFDFVGTTPHKITIAAIKSAILVGAQNRSQIVSEVVGRLQLVTSRSHSREKTTVQSQNSSNRHDSNNSIDRKSDSIDDFSSNLGSDNFAAKAHYSTEVSEASNNFDESGDLLDFTKPFVKESEYLIDATSLNEKTGETTLKVDEKNPETESIFKLAKKSPSSATDFRGGSMGIYQRHTGTDYNIDSKNPWLESKEKLPEKLPEKRASSPENLLADRDDEIETDFSGSDENVCTGSEVILGQRGSDETHAEKEIDTISLWSIKLKPEGSQSVLSNPTAAHPSIVLDVEGEYKIAHLEMDSTNRLSIGYMSLVAKNLEVAVTWIPEPLGPGVDPEKGARLGYDVVVTKSPKPDDPQYRVTVKRQDTSSYNFRNVEKNTVYYVFLREIPLDGWNAEESDFLPPEKKVTCHDYGQDQTNL